MKTYYVPHPVFFALVAAFAALSVPAQAQHVRVLPQAPHSVFEVAQWKGHIGQQLADALASPIAEIKENALEQIIYFARFHGDRLDLTAAVPGLVSIYRSDPAEPCRLAAVAALHALGDEHGMQQVHSYAARQTSELVQQASLGALMDYYGSETFEGSRDMAQMAQGLLRKYEEQRTSEPEPFVVSQ